MITESFLPTFNTLTAKGKLNFIGATLRYFDSFTTYCNDETKSTYIKDYNTKIFPNISTNLSIEDYTEEDLQNILNIIAQKYNLNRATIESRYSHLIFDPCEYYYIETNNISENPLWGASYKCDYSPIHLIPKCLSLETFMLAAKLLSDPYTLDGRRIGLALMCLAALRNNEAAGLNFGDVREMFEYKNTYLLRIVRTSSIDSNQRKIGGKTSNAPRTIPILDLLSELIKARKKYVESKIVFPYTDENGKTYNSIDELPIACKQDKYTIPCSSADLTKAGKAFLRDELKLKEKNISELAFEIRNPINEIDEKDPTTYLFRRNFATIMYSLGMPLDYCQYYMGHLIDDSELNRSDYTDEYFLHLMKSILDRHPLTAKYSSSTISIKTVERESYYLNINNCELGDSIKITINASPKCLFSIHTTESSKPVPSEIDISNKLIETWNKTKPK